MDKQPDIFAGYWYCDRGQPHDCLDQNCPCRPTLWRLVRQVWRHWGQVPPIDWRMHP